jgi:hypothetical protein
MTHQPDPRVEAVREWLLTRHYTPEGAKELAPQCIAAIDALPRPEPAEIGVTEDMIHRALDRWFNSDNTVVHWRSCELASFYRAQMCAALAAALSVIDPRHHAVEPVAGDAVEAAARAMCRAWMERVEEDQAPRRDRPNWVWFGKSIEEAVDKQWRDHADDFASIAAALREITGEQKPSRQERIDAAIAACTHCGGRGFPKRSDCDGCTAAVDEEIASEIAGQLRCETCRDVGWIDQRVGGKPLTPWCECPDCGNPDRMPQP